MAKGTLGAIGRLPRDANGIAIQIGSAFQTQDITGSPIVSPKTVSSSVITLLPPDNAISVTFYATTNDCRISEESTAAANYFVLKAGQQITLGIARMTPLYLLRDAGTDCTLQFLFTTL